PCPTSWPVDRGSEKYSIVVEFEEVDVAAGWEAARTLLLRSNSVIRRRSDPATLARNCDTGRKSTIAVRTPFSRVGTEIGIPLNWPTLSSASPMYVLPRMGSWRMGASLLSFWTCCPTRELNARLDCLLAVCAAV